VISLKKERKIWIVVECWRKNFNYRQLIVLPAALDCEKQYCVRMVRNLVYNSRCWGIRRRRCFESACCPKKNRQRLSRKRIRTKFHQKFLAIQIQIAIHWGSEQFWWNPILNQIHFLPGKEKKQEPLWNSFVFFFHSSRLSSLHISSIQFQKLW